MDFTVALAMLMILSPVMLIAAILIKLNKDGPVFFKQERPGLNGRIFTVYKFRTMSVKTSDENGRQLSDFERIGDHILNIGHSLSSADIEA